MTWAYISEPLSRLQKMTALYVDGLDRWCVSLNSSGKKKVNSFWKTNVKNGKEAREEIGENQAGCAGED